MFVNPRPFGKNVSLSITPAMKRSRNASSCQQSEQYHNTLISWHRRRSLCKHDTRSRDDYQHKARAKKEVNCACSPPWMVTTECVASRSQHLNKCQVQHVIQNKLKGKIKLRYWNKWIAENVLRCEGHLWPALLCGNVAGLAVHLHFRSLVREVPDGESTSGVARGARVSVGLLLGVSGEPGGSVGDSADSRCWTHQIRFPSPDAFTLGQWPDQTKATANL